MRGSTPPVISDLPTVRPPLPSARSGWRQTKPQRGLGAGRADAWYGVAAIVATTVAGLAAGVEPTLVVVGLVGLAVMATILVNVTAGLMIFLLVAFTESLPTVAGAPSIAKVVGLSLALGWLGVITFGRRDDRGSLDFLHHNVFLATTLVLFTSWVLVSQLWAEDGGVAQEAFLRFALNFVLFPIVFVAIRTPRNIAWLYTIFVTGALLVAAAGLQAGGTAEGRLSGGGLNPNELGGLLAVGSILGVVLACYRGIGDAARFVAAVAGLVCSAAVFMTGSRGSLVGLGTALLLVPILAGPGRRLVSLVLVAAGAVAATVWLMLLAPANTVERFSLASGGSGRVDLWTVALRMVNDNPLTGVGAGNFPISSIHYLLEPGVITRPEYFVDQPKVTHNVYLQVMAELGFVGFTLFVATIAACLVSALIAARTFRRHGDRDTELLVRGLLIALTGLLVAEFFSSDLYSKQLYLLLAVAPAALAMARRQACAPRTEPDNAWRRDTS